MSVNGLLTVAHSVVLGDSIDHRPCSVLVADIVFTFLSISVLEGGCLFGGLGTAAGRSSMLYNVGAALIQARQRESFSCSIIIFTLFLIYLFTAMLFGNLYRLVILIPLVHGLSPISRHGKYLYEQDGTRFFVQGVAYQQQGILFYVSRSNSRYLVVSLI